MKHLSVLIILFLLISFSAFSQNEANALGEALSEEEKVRPEFFIIQILEIINSQQIRWNPLMPSHIPPCAFSLHRGDSRFPSMLGLSNEDTGETLALRRDSKGRLIEFPFFMMSEYAKVEVDYYENSDSVKSVNITFIVTPQNNNGEDTALENGEIEGESEELVFSVLFTENFIPYSNFSPGGVFPPLEVRSGEDFYYVFIFEAASFLTETWYDSDGNVLLYCRANIERINNSWRIRSLHINENNETRFIDYYFDSYGNITGIRFDNAEFSALYRDSRPYYLQTPFFREEFQWDTAGNLQVLRSTERERNLYIEYRYQNEFDSGNNWITRREIALTDISGLMVPSPHFSRGTWKRIIIWE